MCVKVIASQRWDVFWDTVYNRCKIVAIRCAHVLKFNVAYQLQNASASGAESPSPAIGASPLNPSGGLPSLRPPNLAYHFQNAPPRLSEGQAIMVAATTAADIKILASSSSVCMLVYLHRFPALPATKCDWITTSFGFDGRVLLQSHRGPSRQHCEQHSATVRYTLTVIFD